jgi:hypothetical protein
MGTLLDAELKTYEDHKEHLLGTAEGKFVLIRNQEVVGFYDAKMDAIAEGYRRFGNVPFLVKQVLRIETPQNFVSSILGI